MDKTRLWIIVSAAAMVAIVALGWFVGLQPQLAAASAADAQIAQVAATNATNAAVLATLQKEYKGLPALKAKLAALATSVPADLQMPAFIDELNGVAGQNGVAFTKWTAADGQAYKPVAIPGQQTPASGSTTSTSSPTPTPTPTPAAALAPVPTAGVPPFVSPLITPANFTVTPITVTVTGSYANVLGFLKGTQATQRLVLVTGFTTKPSTTSPGVEAQVSGLIYTLTTSTPAPATK